MTDSIEPPLTSKVPERPCEVVLAQDPTYETCWQQSFARVLPQERGIHYCSVVIDNKNLQEGLDMLEQDLAALPNVVLIARGPLVSLVAQYYLESFPLAGLVLVDPVLLDHVELLQQVQATLQQCHKAQREFVKGILSGEEARPLKLESGAVPMLIFCSLADSSFHKAAKDVALRHGDPEGIFWDVPVHDISSTDEAVLVAIDMITEWLDGSVL